MGSSAVQCETYDESLLSFLRLIHAIFRPTLFSRDALPPLGKEIPEGRKSMGSDAQFRHDTRDYWDTDSCPAVLPVFQMQCLARTVKSQTFRERGRGGLTVLCLVIRLLGEYVQVLRIAEKAMTYNLSTLLCQSKTTPIAKFCS